MNTIHTPASRDQPTRNLKMAFHTSLPQAFSADEGGEHNQSEGHHDGLVDSQHDARQGHRNLHLEQGLHPGRAKRMAASSVSAEIWRIPRLVSRITGGRA